MDDENLDPKENKMDIIESNETIENSENRETAENNENRETTETAVKHTKLPMSKIKNIVKMDPDVSVVSNEAVFVITKATELFIEAIAKEAYSVTAKGKRKTVTKKDLQTVLDTLDCLCFMEGITDI